MDYQLDADKKVSWLASHQSLLLKGGLLLCYEAVFLLLLVASLYPDAKTGQLVSLSELLLNPVAYLVVNENVILIALALFLPAVLPYLSKIKFGGAEIELLERVDSMEGHVHKIDQNVKEVEKQAQINSGKHEAAFFTIATSLSQQMFANRPETEGGIQGERALVMGQLDFNEAWLMSRVNFLALEEAARTSRSGWKVSEPAPGESTLMTFFRLLTGKIDLFMWYSGTGMMLANGSFEGVNVEDPEAVRSALNKVYEPLGLTWLPSLGFQDSELLVMLKSKADELNIRTMDDLKSHAHLLHFGANREFFLRDWYYPKLQRQGFYFKGVTDEVSLNDRLAGLYDGEFDVGVCMETSPHFTDPRIQVIEPTHEFPRLPQYAMPVCRTDILQDPELAKLLQQFTQISLDDMKGLLSLAERESVNRADHPALIGLAADFWRRARVLNRGRGAAQSAKLVAS